MIKSILQIGSVNWQMPDESTSGSGILHEGHHIAYKDLGLKTYSFYPSRIHESESPDEIAVLRLGHQIPIFTNIPTSSYRFSDMTDEQYKEYEDKLRDFLRKFVDRIEEKQKTPLDLAVAHHAFINAKVINDINIERNKAGKKEIPIAVFVHGTALKMYQREIEENSLRFLPMFREVLKNVKGVFTISKDQKTLFHELFPDYPKDRVIVSPNGFNEKVFNVQKGLKKVDVLSAFKTTESSGGRAFPTDLDYVVTFVGKFADWKRLGALLHAATIYNKVFEKAEKKVATIVAGTGTVEQVAKYEGIAKELGLKNVYFLGPKMHPDLARLYNISDVGVFPSKDEPFGLVLLECMACGTPVIGANSGGPKDFVTSEVGFLVPEAQGEEFNKNLADTVLASWHENWKNKKGKAAEKLAHTKFTLRVQVEGIIKQAEKWV